MEFWRYYSPRFCHHSKPAHLLVSADCFDFCTRIISCVRVWNRFESIFCEYTSHFWIFGYQYRKFDSPAFQNGWEFSRMDEVSGCHFFSRESVHVRTDDYPTTDLFGNHLTWIGNPLSLHRKNRISPMAHGGDMFWMCVEYIPTCDLYGWTYIYDLVKHLSPRTQSMAIFCEFRWNFGAHQCELATRSRTLSS